MSQLDNYIFLLGGKDLEMVAIKELLLENNCKLYDLNLSWSTAKISAYSDHITSQSDDKIIIGIELEQDIDKIPNIKYISIDHHGNRENEASSLEQIALLIGATLNRQRELIAANDRGYKDEMVKIGASESEIKLIRQLDRKYQGATKNDENLAKKSLKGRLENINGITIVYSLTPIFSCITDRLEEEELIVCNRTKLCYYGNQKQKLVDYFITDDKSNDFYHGGDSDGFFGVKEGSRSSEELEEIKNQIVEILKPYSSHIFMLPFRWGYRPDSDNKKQIFDYSLVDKARLDDIVNLESFQEDWSRSISEEFKIEDDISYNKYQYFYDFARPAIFPLEKTPEKKVFEEFKYKNIKKCFYQITIKGAKEPFILQIRQANVRFYDTGVGVFSIHLHNNQTEEFKDILKINDFGRRLFPQFIDSSKICPLEQPRGAFLPKEIAILDKSGKSIASESFCKYACFDENKKSLPNHIRYFFSDKIFKSKVRDCKNKGDIYFQPIMDDRMFTLCWYENDDLALAPITGSKNSTSKTDIDIDIATANDNWTRYIFVDNNGNTIQNPTMLHEYTKKHTYYRWSNYGTLFGISRYSFVILSTSGGRGITLPHLEGIYSEMARLCLAQRASVLRFSDEITHISSLNKTNKDVTKDIEQLNKEYLKFVNKLYFREVSPQEQGIELYDMLQSHMRIERDVKDLDREIQELYHYAKMLSDHEENRIIKRLTTIGVLFLVPSLLVGIFGMNTMPSGNNSPSSFSELFNSNCYSPLWISLFVIFIISILILGIMSCLSKSKRWKRLERCIGKYMDKCITSKK